MDVNKFIGKKVNEIQLSSGMIVIHFTDSSCIEITADHRDGALSWSFYEDEPQ